MRGADGRDLENEGRYRGVVRPSAGTLFVQSAAFLVVLVAVSAATAAAVANRTRQAALVVYQTAASSIAVVRADGSSRHMLPLSKGLQFSEPSLSRDGSRLAFTSVTGSGNTPSFIGISRLDGKGAYAIRLPENIDLDGPSWSPDGRLIAFNAYPVVSDTGTVVNNADLWVARADGSHPRLLLNSANTAGDPSGIATQQGSSWMWSPDGRSIAIQWPSGDPRGLILNVEIVNVRNGEVRVLAQGSEPAWSPDGRRIAFISATGIDVIGADGSGRRRVVRMPTAESDQYPVEPSWSHDGKTIAYWTGAEHPALKLIDAAGRSKPRMLFRPTSANPIPYRPEWSHDSRTLLVSAYSRGVWIVPVRAGSRPRELAKNGFDADWRG